MILLRHSISLTRSEMNCVKMAVGQKIMRKDPPTITSSIFSNVSLVYVPYGSKAK